MNPIQKKVVSSSNTIYLVVEETFLENEFSIVVFDEHDLWIEKFVNGFEKAVEYGKNLFNKIVTEY